MEFIVASLRPSLGRNQPLWPPGGWRLSGGLSARSPHDKPSAGPYVRLGPHFDLDRDQRLKSMVKRLLLAIVSVVLLAGSPAFAGRQHLNREARTDDLKSDAGQRAREDALALQVRQPTETLAPTIVAPAAFLLAAAGLWCRRRQSSSSRSTSRLPKRWVSTYLTRSSPAPTTSSNDPSTHPPADDARQHAREQFGSITR